VAGYEVSWADPYQELRKVLDPRYARLSPDELEDLFDRAGVPAEELESFLGTVQRIGQGVVGALPQVLPGVLPVVGTALGGPVGGALGAVAGQAVGQALTPGRPAQLVATPQPAQPVGAPQPAPAAAPQAPPVVPSAAPSAPSAAQLLQTMFRPETLMALISMVM
jgi:hypothetical protein